MVRQSVCSCMYAFTTDIKLTTLTCLMFPLLQDGYTDALNKLQQTVIQAYKVDPNIKFEVFIHKVDGLSDDQRIDIQRDIHQRAHDDLLDASTCSFHCTGFLILLQILYTTVPELMYDPFGRNISLFSFVLHLTSSRKLLSVVYAGDDRTLSRKENILLHWTPVTHVGAFVDAIRAEVFLVIFRVYVVSPAGVQTLSSLFGAAIRSHRQTRRAACMCARQASIAHRFE